LTRKPGGTDGAQWVIDYDTGTASDDEVGFRLDKHRLVPGEYVSIADHLGSHAFLVTSVEELADTEQAKA